MGDRYKHKDESREKRHDFINHLQVIYSLIETGKTERAMKYIKELSRELSGKKEVLD